MYIRSFSFHLLETVTMDTATIVQWNAIKTDRKSVAHKTINSKV